MSLRRVCTFLITGLVVSIPLWFPGVTAAQAMPLYEAMNPGNWFVSGVAELLNLFVSFLGFILYWLGRIFEYTLNFTLYTNYTDITAIQEAWTLLRDLLNIVFIFLLLYVAISTILNADTTGWRKQVVQVIVAAILVNFSLFLTGIVVDAGNLLAIQFNEVVTTCDPATHDGCDDDGTQNISTSFMYGMGLQESFAENAFGATRGSAEENAIRNALIRIVLLSVMIWAFISIALLFVVRTVVLFLIFVTAPLGVAGSGLPLLSGKAGEWRQELFKQTFVPVVFLLFAFLIVTLIAETGVFTTTGDSFGETVAEARDESMTGEDVFSLVILVAMIIAAVRITKNMSGKAGEAVDGIGKAALGLGIGAAAGGAALAGRATLGSAANRVVGNQGLQRTAVEGKGVRRAAARAALGGANWTTKQSFDPRQAPGVERSLKNIGVADSAKAKGLGPLSTEQTKGGYEAAQKRQGKRATDFAGLLGHDKQREEEAMSQYDAQTERLQTEIQNAEAEISQRQTGDPDDEREVLRLTEEVKKNQEALSKRTDDERKKQAAKLKAQLTAERKEQYAQTIEDQPGLLKRARRLGFDRSNNDPMVAAVRKEAEKDRKQGNPIDELRKIISEADGGQGGQSSGSNP